MNVRPPSLRSPSRSNAAASKRAAPDDPAPSKKSHSSKKSKKSSHEQPLPANRTDVLPPYEVLTKLAEPATYHRALLLKQAQKRELHDLEHSLSTTPCSRAPDEQADAKDRLLRVLRWKLLRGQFRAMLPALVAQNAADEVDRCVRKARGQLDGCRTSEQAVQSGALATMCELRGVGPATAAAFLAFEAPGLVPVFSDEAASFFEASLGPVIKYTLPFYTKFVACLAASLQTLVQQDDSWDLRRLERALWTFRVLQKLLSEHEWRQLTDVADQSTSATTVDTPTGQSNNL